MKVESVLQKLQTTSKEFELSGFSVNVPESVLQNGVENFIPDSNKYLGLLVQLGIFIEQGKIFQVFRDRKEKLEIRNYDAFLLNENTKVTRYEFDNTYYKDLKKTLKLYFYEDVRNWMSRLFVFSLMAQNLNLEIEQDDNLEKLDLQTYFKNSSRENFCFNLG
ncbi:MAG: hypothetical protein ABIJ05_01180 [Patescibacteria group bacterium]